MRPYQRVAQLDSYPYPRPVIIYGPLADKAMSLLVEEVSTLEDHSEEPRFEVPPISGAPPQPDDIFASSLCSPSPGVIRLSAIQVRCQKFYKYLKNELKTGSVSKTAQNLHFICLELLKH